MFSAEERLHEFLLYSVDFWSPQSDTIDSIGLNRYSLLKTFAKSVVKLKRKTKQEYGAAILRAVGAAAQPLDVERIRVECSIGNWQTALKHCLELLHEGKIQGTKTSKSWVFWSNSSRAFSKVRN